MEAGTNGLIHYPVSFRIKDTFICLQILTYQVHIFMKFSAGNNSNSIISNQPSHYNHLQHQGSGYQSQQWPSWTGYHTPSSNTSDVTVWFIIIFLTTSDHSSSFRHYFSILSFFSASLPDCSHYLECTGGEQSEFVSSTRYFAGYSKKSFSTYFSVS